jgi:murein endopeptidase
MARRRPLSPTLAARRRCRRLALGLACLTAGGAGVAVGAATSDAGAPAQPKARAPEATAARAPAAGAEQIRRRRSRALGTPANGRLANGVLLPAEGPTWFTWDPIRSKTPNRAWRRHGTDRLIRLLFHALDDYATRHPDAPRVGIGDLSRPRGGDFGPKYGIVGHATHQNGLDADLYYPRRDARERPALLTSDMHRRRAQALIDALVRAGVEEVLVGPSTGLTGPRGVVRQAAGHDNHLHVRVR